MYIVIISIIVGVVAGLSVGVQNPISSLVGQRIGILQGAFMIHVGGALAAGVLLLMLPGSHLAVLKSTPWYAFPAGALGVVFISGINYTIPRIGVAPTVGLIVAAQLIVGAIFDHYGFLEVVVRPFDLWKLAGVAFLLGGTWLVLR